MIRYDLQLLTIVGLSMVISPLPVSAKPSADRVALEAVNKSLKAAPLDPRLNYLAALSYEATSVIGTDRREMARVGYNMALKGDPTFWPAHVQLGLLAMEDRNATTAQGHFTAAALFQPTEPMVYYNLSRAAFCAGDLLVAHDAWVRATSLRAPQTTDEFITGAAVLKSSGDLDGAQYWVEQLKAIGAPIPAMIRLATFISPAESTTSADGSLIEEETSAFAKMGMVDVIILRRDEQAAQFSGINLLDALTLQFGSTLVNTSWNSSRDRIEGSQTSSTIDRSGELTVTVPSVTYSLNVANSLGSQSTIQAQQALLIYDGQTSKVQIGRSLTFAVDGSFESAVSTQEDGLQIEIGADFAEAGTVKLDINASLQNFLPGGGPGSFRQSVLTEKTTTNVTASLEFGETVVIASGGTTINSRGFSRTPVIGSLPLIGNLFNARDRKESDTSILILLTLRQRGSHELPHNSAAERERFELKRNRLLDQLGGGKGDPDLSRFTPDKQILSYELANPARKGDADYLKRASVLTM
jgi:hypothetical protein